MSDEPNVKIEVTIRVTQSDTSYSSREIATATIHDAMPWGRVKRSIGGLVEDASDRVARQLGTEQEKRTEREGEFVA